MSNDKNLTEVQVPSIVKEVTSLPQKVKIGQQIQAQPIQKFSASKGQQHIISFLDTAGTPYRLHYIKKSAGTNPDGTPKEQHLGSVHHTSEIANLSEVAPFSLYYLIPILEYSKVGITPDGKPIAGEPFYFKYLQVKDSVWNTKICGLLESVNDPTKTDFLITLTPGREQYQDMIISPRKDGEAVWRKNAKFNAGVNELVDYFDSVSRSLAGKDLSVAEVLQFFHGDSNQQALNSAIKALPMATGQQLLVDNKAVNLADFTS